jgi:viologen exporter family transport system permease protein
VSRSRWPRVVSRTAARRTLADPSELAVELVFYVVVVLMVSGLWRAAAGGQGGSVAGYGAAALTWYIATSEAATIAIDFRMIEVVGRDISSGSVAVELLRPVSVLGVRLADELGRTLTRLAGCVVVGVVLASAVGGAPPRPAALVLAVPSLVLAVACNLAAQHAVAAVAFWLRDATAAWFLYWKLVFVAGGMLIPLEAMPGWLETVAHVLPFQAMAYAPARLASGHVEPLLLVQQAAWLVVLAALARLVFTAGERRLQVVGG